MTRELRNTLIALSHNEELSAELREAIRRELGDYGAGDMLPPGGEFVAIPRMEG
jgi:hypothetical protein